ncbi:hypothetical protein [Shewanella youngdeokensis]|uniref:Uncharacterized protein n=1 Tax=Shewanella youngdeokensis TaxID=2999068 RepID=A0ABZ0K0J0_9GAMM|nr:hypothetical protein RGE70_00595 [Shewanella sp. DAU334]
MDKWFNYGDGVWRFKFDAESYSASQEAAKHCNYFAADDEDEQTDDQLRSCFNCLFRRWHVNGFDCYHRPPQT